MQQLKIQNGYEIHSNTQLPDELYNRFNKDLVLLLKSSICQYYFKVHIEKEWGITMRQLYKMCSNQEIVAFGLTVPYKKYIIMSIIGYRSVINFQRFYHIYKPTQTFCDAVLIFPYTMILNINFDPDNPCIICKTTGTYTIQSQVYCLNNDCMESDIKLKAKNFSFGKAVLTLEQVVQYKFNSSPDCKKKLCKQCKLNKPHDICSYERYKKKINVVRNLICESHKNS